MNKKLGKDTMSQRFIALIAFLGFVVAPLLTHAATVSSNNRRAMSRSGSMSASIARSTEIDSCSSRNVAENINYFFKCLQGKMSTYMTKTTTGAPQWNKSMVFAVQKGAVQTASLVLNVQNRSLFSQWKNYYTQFQKIQAERNAQVELMLDGSLDEDPDSDETQDALAKLTSKQAVLTSQLEALQGRWDTFIDKVANQTDPGPYPTIPDATAPVFQRQTPKPGVWMIDEGFYSAVRKVLDQNPNAHLQLMKYYLLERPARFRTMKQSQVSFSQANKIFRVSLMCSDKDSIKGAILSIAASAAPPLPYLPLAACQFDGKRIGKSDQSQINSNSISV